LLVVEGVAILKLSDQKTMLAAIIYKRVSIGYGCTCTGDACTYYPILINWIGNLGSPHIHALGMNWISIIIH
jgi:hypothetical protein